MACHHLTTSLTTIVISCLLFPLGSAYDTNNTGLATACTSNDTGLVDDDYKVNVEILLTDLVSTSATSTLSFYNTTSGQHPYKSYGFYLCRGDASSQLCNSCLTNLTTWVVSSYYTNCTEGIAYADFCMFRYANYSLFGKADNGTVGAWLDKYEYTFSQEYNRTLVDAVNQVISLAAYNSSNLFATYEEKVGDGNETVYALAQCTPDITRGGCGGCLRAAQSYALKEPVRPRFVFEMRRSCQLRYDNASFFVFPSTTPSLANALVPARAFVGSIVGLFFVGWMIMLC